MLLYSQILSLGRCYMFQSLQLEPTARGFWPKLFSITPDRTLAKEVSLALNNLLSLVDNSFATTAEFFFFHSQPLLLSNSSSSHSSLGLLAITDRQLRSHTARPSFVPAQWSDHEDHEDTSDYYRSRFGGPRQALSTPANAGNIPLPTRPRASSILPLTRRPSFIRPPLYLFARPAATQAQYSRTMPSSGNRSAPKFDGHPPLLKCFFDEVDYLGDSCGLSAVEKIQHTLRYLDFREYETWRSWPSARGSN